MNKMKNVGLWCDLYGIIEINKGRKRWRIIVQCKNIYYIRSLWYNYSECVLFEIQSTFFHISSLFRLASRNNENKNLLFKKQSSLEKKAASIPKKNVPHILLLCKKQIFVVTTWWEYVYQTRKRGETKPLGMTKALRLLNYVLAIFFSFLCFQAQNRKKNFGYFSDPLHAIREFFSFRWITSCLFSQRYQKQIYISIFSAFGYRVKVNDVFDARFQQW